MCSSFSCSWFLSWVAPGKLAQLSVRHICWQVISVCNSLEEELSCFEIYFESFPQPWATSLPNTLANSDTVRTHHSSTCFRFVTCLDFAVEETILSSISDGQFNTRWGGRRCHSNSLQTDLLPDRLHNSAGIR